MFDNFIQIGLKPVAFRSSSNIARLSSECGNRRAQQRNLRGIESSIFFSRCRGKYSRSSIQCERSYTIVTNQ